MHVCTYIVEVAHVRHNSIRLVHSHSYDVLLNVIEKCYMYISILCFASQLSSGKGK